MIQWIRTMINLQRQIHCLYAKRARRISANGMKHAHQYAMKLSIKEPETQKCWKSIIFKFIKFCMYFIMNTRPLLLSPSRKRPILVRTVLNIYRHVSVNVPPRNSGAEHLLTTRGQLFLTNHHKMKLMWNPQRIFKFTENHYLLFRAILYLPLYIQ